MKSSFLYHIILVSIFFSSCSKSKPSPKFIEEIKIVEFERVFNIPSGSTYDEFSYSVLSESHAKILLESKKKDFKRGYYYVLTKDLSISSDSQLEEVCFRKSKISANSLSLWECSAKLRCLDTPPLDFVRIPDASLKHDGTDNR